MENKLTDEVENDIVKSFRYFESTKKTKISKPVFFSGKLGEHVHTKFISFRGDCFSEIWGYPCILTQKKSHEVLIA